MRKQKNGFSIPYVLNNIKLKIFENNFKETNELQIKHSRQIVDSYFVKFESQVLQKHIQL